MRVVCQLQVSSSCVHSATGMRANRERTSSQRLQLLPVVVVVVCCCCLFVVVVVDVLPLLRELPAGTVRVNTAARLSRTAWEKKKSDCRPSSNLRGGLTSVVSTGLQAAHPAESCSSAFIRCAGCLSPISPRAAAWRM